MSVPSGRGSPFEIFEEGREKRQSRADQPSPIPIPSDRRSMVPPSGFSFSQPPPPFTTSTPIQQSGFGGGPTPMPRTRDSFGMPLNWVEDQFAHPSALPPPSTPGSGSLTPLRRGSSGSISTPPVIEQFLNPDRSGRPAPTPPARRSFSPVRRGRSGSISTPSSHRTIS